MAELKSITSTQVLQTNSLTTDSIRVSPEDNITWQADKAVITTTKLGQPELTTANSATSTELNTLGGASGNIQTQLNGKAYREGFAVFSGYPSSGSITNNGCTLTYTSTNTYTLTLGAKTDYVIMGNSGGTSDGRNLPYIYINSANLGGNLWNGRTIKIWGGGLVLATNDIASDTISRGCCVTYPYIMTNDGVTRKEVDDFITIPRATHPKWHTFTYVNGTWFTGDDVKFYLGKIGDSTSDRLPVKSSNVLQRYGGAIKIITETANGSPSAGNDTYYDCCLGSDYYGWHHPKLIRLQHDAAYCNVHIRLNKIPNSMIYFSIELSAYRSAVIEQGTKNSSGAYGNTCTAVQNFSGSQSGAVANNHKFLLWSDSSGNWSWDNRLDFKPV